MPNKYVNNFSTTIASPLTSVGTSLSLTSTAGLPLLVGGDTCLLTLYRQTGPVESGHEVVRITSISGNVVTIVRGIEGAAPSAFAIGDRVGARLTAGAMQELSNHASFIGNPHGVTKADVGLGNVSNTADINLPISSATQAALNNKVNLSAISNINNTADANKPVSTAQAAADVTTLNSAKSYAESLVVGLWDDRGNYSAAGGTYPTTGGSGSAGAVLKGDIWTISVGGTLSSVQIDAKQTLRALIDAPGQTAANWAIASANTALDDTITDNVVGRAPSQNSVFKALALKAPLASPILTGIPTAPTAAVGNKTTQIATTSFTYAAMAAFGIGGQSTMAALFNLNNAPIGGVISVNGLESDAVTYNFPRTGSVGTTPVWYNVLTYGTATRLTQVAVFAFSGANHSRTFAREFHDTAWTGWRELVMYDSLAAAGGAALIGNAPSGGLVATTVQAAIVELDVDKAPKIAPIFSGQAQFAEGTASAPSIAFVNDGAPDTGFYHVSDGIFGATCNTIPVALFTSSGVQLQGSPTAPTAAVDSNNLQIINSAYLSGQLASVAPLMNGAASVGVSARIARQDHAHPSDTSKMDKTGGTFSGGINAPSINGGQLAGNRNRTTNGGCQVAQRGNVTVSAALQYGGCDMFLTGITSATGISGTIQQMASSQTTATGFSQAIIGASFTTGRPTFNTRVESRNVYDLSSKVVTISGVYYHDTGSPLNIAIGLGKPSLQDNFGSVANLYYDSSQIIPSGAYTPFKATFTLAAGAAVNGLEVSVSTVNAITAVSKTFRVGDIQLEIGSVATQFEQRPIGMELALCQRYYQSLPGLLLSGYGPAAGNIYGDFTLPVTMRVNPSVTLSNFSNANTSSPTLNLATSSHVRLMAQITALGAANTSCDLTAAGEL